MSEPRFDDVELRTARLLLRAPADGDLDDEIIAAGTSCSRSVRRPGTAISRHQRRPRPSGHAVQALENATGATVAEGSVGRYALRHPGRYAATVRAPAVDDTEHNEAAARVLTVMYAVLAGYGLTGADAVDATRALRAALHGFVTLESGGGFEMPRPVELSFARLIDGLDVMLSSWATSAASPHSGRARR